MVVVVVVVVVVNKKRKLRFLEVKGLDWMRSLVRSTNPFFYGN